jgi:centromeric protein E
MEGYNTVIFAYGQTGSRKTYTLSGESAWYHSSKAAANPVEIQGGGGGDVILTPLREEVVASFKGVKDSEVLKRGEACEGDRRRACPMQDWRVQY